MNGLQCKMRVTNLTSESFESHRGLRQGNEDEQPTDVAGIEQKLPRRRQQTKGLKSASATKHILSEESVNENDTPVKKRGRTQKKASEVDVLAETSNSTPLRRGRTKKALQIVEETASTDNQNNETDKLAQDETKSVDEKANVEVNNVTESGKEEQDIVKPVVKGHRRKIEAHKEEDTGHNSAETVQEATKPASKGRRRKVEEPQEKEWEKEVSETVQDEPKVVGRGRRRKIEVHNEDEAVKKDVVAVAQQTTKPDSNESTSAEMIDIAAPVSSTNQEENYEIKKLIRTPQSISCADADQNELSCIDLEDSVDPLPSAVDIEGNRQVEGIPSTPKPISAIDEDQNELSCEYRVDAEEVELQELNRTPKPISTIDEDQNESIELAVADDPVSPAATVEDTCEVEQIFDEKPNASTCTDLADVVEDVASTGNVEENDEGECACVVCGHQRTRAI